jgi:hypothetical protein
LEENTSKTRLDLMLELPHTSEAAVRPALDFLLRLFDSSPK